MGWPWSSAEVAGPGTTISTRCSCPATETGSQGSHLCGPGDVGHRRGVGAEGPGDSRAAPPLPGPYLPMRAPAGRGLWQISRLARCVPPSVLGWLIGPGCCLRWSWAGLGYWAFPATKQHCQRGHTGGQVPGQGWRPACCAVLIIHKTSPFRWSGGTELGEPQQGGLGLEEAASHGAGPSGWARSLGPRGQGGRAYPSSKALLVWLLQAHEHPTSASLVR